MKFPLFTSSRKPCQNCGPAREAARPERQHADSEHALTREIARARIERLEDRVAALKQGRIMGDGTFRPDRAM